VTRSDRRKPVSGIEKPPAAGDPRGRRSDRPRVRPGDVVARGVEHAPARIEHLDDDGVEVALRVTAWSVASVETPTMWRSSGPRPFAPAGCVPTMPARPAAPTPCNTRRRVSPCSCSPFIFVPCTVVTACVLYFHPNYQKRNLEGGRVARSGSRGPPTGRVGRRPARRSSRAPSAWRLRGHRGSGFP